MSSSYCQWEQIGTDGKFVFFNPAKGMVLRGDGPGKPLLMAQPAFATVEAQNFSWGATVAGSRALQWYGSEELDIDAGTGDSPADTPVTLSPWRNGGVSFKNEPPQADQLRDVVQQYDVKLIVLSIGGNDLGFADIITACVSAFTSSGSTCNATQQQNVLKLLAPTKLKVMKAVLEIREAMKEAGQGDPTEYKIVVQSAPSPIPMGKDFRYPEKSGITGPRVVTGGCPFWNADADWAKGQLVSEIANMLKEAARNTDAGFLDLQQAFDGREVCAL